MSHEIVNTVMAVAVTLRVFAPDARDLTRRLLGYGVRVGASALSEQRRAAAALGARGEK